MLNTVCAVVLIEIVYKQYDNVIHCGNKASLLSLLCLKNRLINEPYYMEF